MLSERLIEKYREIHREQSGAELTRDEAAEQANRLLIFARIVHQPMPKDWEKRYNELFKEKYENENQYGKRECLPKTDIQPIPKPDDRL
jgi:primosomal protein N''